MTDIEKPQPDERTRFQYQWFDPQYRSGGTLADDIARPAIQMTVLARDGEDPWRILAEVGRAAALMGAAIQEADNVRREVK
jgi:hypothetical protein